MDVILHLRPHHLLCLQTFVGLGYSEEFVRNMTRAKEALGRDPSTAIKLVRGADDLCGACPNCEEGHCTSEKPARFDANVLRKLAQEGIIREDGREVCLQGIPEELTISPALLDECCAGCEWKESTCMKYIQENKTV